jgi:hypothetical protein
LIDKEFVGELVGDAITFVQGLEEGTGGSALAVGSDGVLVVPGVAISVHGAALTVSSASHIAHTVYLMSDAAHDNKSTSGSSDEGSLDTEGIKGNDWKKNPPDFAKNAKWGKNDKGEWGWIDRKGNFITKGDKPGEWHVNPNPNTKNPLFDRKKPRRGSKQPYWNVDGNGNVTH